MKQLVDNPFLPGRALRSGRNCDKMMRVKLISANSTQWNTPPVLLIPRGIGLTGLITHATRGIVPFASDIINFRLNSMF